MGIIKNVFHKFPMMFINENSRFLVFFFSLITIFLAFCGFSRLDVKPKQQPTSKASFVWVDNGDLKAPIIVSDRVTPRNLEATEELANYINKISGVKPPIIKRVTKEIPNKAVWIGYHKELEQLFPNVNFKLGEEEILIVANANHLAILGNDGLQFNYQDIVFRNKLVRDAQWSYGTVNAIYTFLQEHLKVRWFWPNELGVDIIVSKTISIEFQEYKYKPQFTWRSGIFLSSHIGKFNKETDLDVWSKRQRLFLSKEMILPGHPFNDWWDKYHISNPDIFAITDKGTRTPRTDKRYVKLCVSNPGIANIWLKEVESQLSDNPFLEYFNVNENDGFGAPNHCYCQKCQKWDAVSVYSKNQNLSDRHLKFANTLLDSLRSKYPDRPNLKVVFFAYGASRPLPLRELPKKGVSVVAVSNFHLRRKSKWNSNEPSIEEFYNWSKISDEIFWRPNLGNPVGLKWGMPDIAFNQIFEDFRFVAENKCKGVFFDNYPNHWATQGIQYYLASQLAWNPYLNKEELLSDYFSRLYGPAQDEMRKYWQLCEDTRLEMINRYGSDSARYFIHDYYDSVWVKKAKTIITIAKKKTVNFDSKYLKRIEFTEAGLIHTERIVRLRLLVAQYQKKVNKEIMSEVNKIWTDIVNDNYGSRAINIRILGLGEKQKNVDERKKNKKLSKILNGIILESKHNKSIFEIKNDYEDDGLE
jgi:hypothetical protein